MWPKLTPSQMARAAGVFHAGTPLNHNTLRPWQWDYIRASVFRGLLYASAS